MIEYLKGQKFRQRIELLELTKQLEREPCDSLSFTHRLQKNLFPYSSFVTPKVTKISGNANREIKNDIYSYYITPSAIDQDISLYKIFFNDGAVSGQITTFFYLYKETDLENPLYSVQLTTGNTGDIFATLSQLTTVTEGKYLLRYRLIFTLSIPGGMDSSETVEIEYEIEVKSPQIATKPIPSITDVINRILDVGLPRMAYQTPKYHLDPVIAEKLASVPSPEFFLPRMTLFESLLTVGHYIHAIPRLVFNETTQKADTITYDFLGLDEEYTFPSSSCIVGYKNIQNGDDYCGALDDYAENVVNTIDPGAGSITEQWKTLRTASGQAIDNDTAVIETEKPIYRIIKVEMGYTDNSTDAIVGDITQFVYEQAEYDGLFVSDKATYPNSVSYALCYQQGTRYIKGFNTTSSSLLNLIQKFKEPSIVKIAKLARNNNYIIDTDQLYGNLAFRVTYIPMDNLRIRQYKPYTGYPNDNIFYNQQNANTVEANYYGENLKGKIARLGNEIQVYTVRFKHASELPRVGMILADDEKKPYIYKITTKRARNFITADIYCTQDFNRLSEYFGLNSNFRLYEVSERQSIDRQVIVPRIIRVSFSEDLGDALNRGREAIPITSDWGARRFMDTFAQENRLIGNTNFQKNAKVTVMRLLDDDGNQIGDYCYAKAVNSVALGNSLSFSWAFEDNFSAGNRSTPSGSYQWKQQKTSPYGGVYGNFYLLEFAVGADLWRYKREGVMDVGEVLPISYEEQKNGYCDALPTIKQEYYDETFSHSFFRTFEGIGNEGILGRDVRVVVDKNSSEHISVSLQFHGQADDKRIILGSKMWTNNGLIRENFPDNGKMHWYGLPTKLNMLRGKVDLTNATILDKIDGFDVDIFMKDVANDLDLIPIGALTLPTIPSGANYKSIAVCNEDGDLYIGVNLPLPSSSCIYFHFDLNP